MGWRDQLGPAKFRGVPFLVDSAERDGGRRNVVHEYPKRDVPSGEDLGRKAETFPVEGYVIGPDYHLGKNALIEALRAGGPGELLHPYHGVQRVLVGAYKVRETRDEGGMARFSITFLEAGEDAQPTSVPDAAGTLRSSAAAARDSVRAEFLAQYAPGAFLGSVSNALRSATLEIDKQVSAVDMDAQARAQFRARLSGFAASVGALVRKPEDLLAEIVSLVGSFAKGYRALVDLYAFDPGVRPPATTSNREREQRNFDATRRVIQRLAVIRAAELVLEEKFASYEEAITAQGSLTALLDDQAETAADDAYPALMQLRADLVKAVPGPGGGLPHLVRFTPPATLPSLVIAHRLYGDVASEADIIARNGIAHPGFVLGGREIEVVTRE